MHLSKIKNKLVQTYSNALGWKTNRKIVVFESDDWGSIRMPSKKVYEKLLHAGIRVDKCHYNKYDSLASEDDLTALYEVLSKFKDKNGNPPVITANTIMANPDFEKIRKDNFANYFYEPFTETLKSYPKHHNSFALWQEGILNGLILPQYHGREHLNIKRWLDALISGSKETHFAFENQLFGISTTISKEKRKSYMAALDLDDLKEIPNQISILKDGLKLFEKKFNFKSSSFIAPNYTWHTLLEDSLFQNGITYFQSANAQKIPTGDGFTVKRHSFGETNKIGQIYLGRNVKFEPSEVENTDCLALSLKGIENAFFWNKPAIISTHRVNFIGYIDENNRTKNLKLLTHLLNAITQRYPEVEFMNTRQLGALIVRKQFDK
jgi:hypothetical protein